VASKVLLELLDGIINKRFLNKKRWQNKKHVKNVENVFFTSMA